MRAHKPADNDKEDGPGRNAPTAHRPEVAPSAGLVSPKDVPALQRRLGNAVVARMLAVQREQQREEPDRRRSAVRDVLRSPGKPLDEPVRREMESRIGADFSNVRVHTDSAAHTTAESVQAHAFTSGSHIVFQRGRYDPASSAGKHMLAHELTHVVQQRSGPVAGTDTGGGLRMSDPSDSFERAAEANATRVMSGPASLQRERDEDTAEAAPDGAESAKTVAGEAIQRAIGVEVEESNWRVVDSAGQAVRKGTPLVHRPFFQLQAEYAGTGKSNIELVTNPPGVVNREEWDTMREGMKALLDDLLRRRKDLSKPREGRQGAETPAIETAHLPGGEQGYRIHPSALLSPHLQVTAGVPLAALPTLLDRLKDAGATVTWPAKDFDALRFAPKENDQGSDTGETKAIEDPKGKRRDDGGDRFLLPGNPSEELVGFITLLDTYLRAGADRSWRTFPKAVFQVMARTDFATMFALLPEPERTAVASNLSEWVRLMAGREGINDPTGKDPVLAGWFLDPDDTEATSGMKITTTRREFLEAMVPRDDNPGRDLLTARGRLGLGPDEDEETLDVTERAKRLAAHAQTGKSPGRNAAGLPILPKEFGDIEIPEDRELVKRLASDLRELYQGMGELGARTDEVRYDGAAENTPTVVVEIRSPGSGGWYTLMEGIYEAVDEAIAAHGAYTKSFIQNPT